MRKQKEKLCKSEMEVEIKDIKNTSFNNLSNSTALAIITKTDYPRRRHRGFISTSLFGNGL